MQLVKQDLVTYEEALNHVSNPDDFALRFRGISSTSDATWGDFDKEDEDEEKPLDPDEEVDVAEEGDFKIDRF